MEFIAELGRYGAAGLIGTAVHYAIMAALLLVFSLDVVLATTAGAIAGAWVNYVLNYFYTFRSDKGHRGAIAKFWLVAAIGWVVNAGIMALNEGLSLIGVIPAQLTATAVVFFFTFLMNRSWTF